MNNVDKVMASAADAVADIPEGASLAVGGFGLCGIPTVLIGALLAQGAGGLSVVSRSTGINGSSRRMMRVGRGSHLGTPSARDRRGGSTVWLPGAMPVIWSSPAHEPTVGSISQVSARARSPATL